MKLLITTGEGVLVWTNRVLQCWAKRVRIIAYDTVMEKVIVDRVFVVDFGVKYQDLRSVVRNSWDTTFPVHRCWFDAAGGKSSKSINKIIRNILLLHEVEKIFYKGKLMRNFLNEINLEDEEERGIIHKNMVELGRKYDIAPWTIVSEFSREDRIFYLLEELLKKLKIEKENDIFKELEND